jgi:hypothetical protein
MKDMENILIFYFILRIQSLTVFSVQSKFSTSSKVESATITAAMNFMPGYASQPRGVAPGDFDVPEFPPQPGVFRYQLWLTITIPTS